MTQLQEMGLSVAPTPQAAEGRALGPTPPRPLHSLRRTASQQAYWPDGIGRNYEMISRARDLFTGASPDETTLCGEDWVTAQMQIDTVVNSFSASRCAAELSQLTGLRVGGQLRKAVAEALPDEPRNSTRLYRMIDDMAGGAFLSGASWQSWLAGGMDDYAKAIGMGSVMKMVMEGTCQTYAPGSPALHPDGRQNQELAYRSIGLIAADRSVDPDAWHEMPAFDGPNQSRLRFMDVWREGGKVRVTFGFQDSSAFPGTDLRRLFHEYRGQAVVDPDNFILEEIEMEFGSLPYTLCHNAAVSPQQLVGRSLADFRKTVIDLLKGTAGCTHLNDSLRTLQDVPALVRTLDKCLKT